MGLKILHTADWHLGSPFSSFSDAQRKFLRRAQLELPGKIADLCRAERCDLMLVAGDLFDGKPDREMVDAVKQALKECGVPVFIAPGNHDFVETGSPWLEAHWPENVVVFTGGLETVAVPQLDARIYGAGYHSMDCEGLLEGFRAFGTEKYQIGVLHGDPVTGRSPYCPITASQVRDSGLTYLALGHIHKGGLFRTESTYCAWPGCPMGRGWDETGEKGICIVQLQEEADIRFVPLDTPRFFDLEVDLSGGRSVEDILPAAGRGDFYRITLTGQTDVDVEALRKKYSALTNLVLRDRTERRKDLWADAGADSFRGVYFRLLQERSADDSRAVLAAEISHKILSKREVELP